MAYFVMGMNISRSEYAAFSPEAFFFCLGIICTLAALMLVVGVVTAWDSESQEPKESSRFKCSACKKSHFTLFEDKCASCFTLKSTK
jgi:hypothetical protein